MQFSIRTLLLATAIFAIEIGGLTATVKMLNLLAVFANWHLVDLLTSAGISAPCWVPIAGAALAVSSRSLTAKTVVLIGIAEAAAIACTAITYKLC